MKLLAKRVGCEVVDDNFLPLLQCEKTKECLNDLKEKLREAFKKASKLTAALERKELELSTG